MLAPESNSTATHPRATEPNPEPGSSRLPSSRKDSTPVSHASGSGPTLGSRSLSSSGLSRFSYNPPQSLRDMIKKRGELEAQRIAQNGPPQPLRRSRAAKPAAHRFTDYFTDNEISRILKCVSCGFRWTIRKGATAKMRHIQSCAKKNGLDDEMIKGLIRAELEAPEEPGPGEIPRQSGVSNTLFEDTLWDTEKTKKKRKPAQRTTTVHNPVDNREAILAKARSLLPEIRDLSEDPELVDLLKRSDSRMDRIQMFDSSDPPPATQEFGRSRLGQQTSSDMLNGLSGGSPKMSTTSALASKGKGRRLDISTGEEMESESVSVVILHFERFDDEPQPISVHSSIDIPFERLSLEPLYFQVGDVQSDHGSEVSWHNDSAILHYNQKDDNTGWDNNDFIHDDAILHFNPGERDGPLLRELSPQLETPAPAYTPSTTVDSAAPAKRAKGQKAAKPRSRRKRTNVESDNPTQSTEVNDTELKSKMLDAIRKDDELYHRILRYEVCPPLVLSRQESDSQLIESDHSRSLWMIS